MSDFLYLSLSDSLTVSLSDSLSNSSDELGSKSSLTRFSVLFFIISYLHSSNSVWG